MPTGGTYFSDVLNSYVTEDTRAEGHQAKIPKLDPAVQAVVEANPIPPTIPDPNSQPIFPPVQQEAKPLDFQNIIRAFIEQQQMLLTMLANHADQSAKAASKMVDSVSKITGQPMRTKIPAELKGALEKLEKPFEMNIRRYQKAKKTAESRNADLELMQKADTHAYPKGIRPLKTCPTRKEMDNKWSEVEAGEKILTIKVPQGATCSQAMLAIHHQCYRCIMAIESEATHQHASELKKEASKQVLFDQMGELITKSENKTYATELGLTEPTKGNLPKEEIEKFAEAMYLRIMKKVSEEIEKENETNKKKKEKEEKELEAFIRTDPSKLLDTHIENKIDIRLKKKGLLPDGNDMIIDKEQEVNAGTVVNAITKSKNGKGRGADKDNPPQYMKPVLPTLNRTAEKPPPQKPPKGQPGKGKGKGKGKGLKGGAYLPGKGQYHPPQGKGKNNQQQMQQHKGRKPKGAQKGNSKGASKNGKGKAKGKGAGKSAPKGGKHGREAGKKGNPPSNGGGLAGSRN